MSNFRERPRGTLARFKSQKVEVERSYGLRSDHPAVVEGRTLFPTTVIGSMGSPRLLVSGQNNAKLGEHVTKGDRAGWKIYQLSLEERATCPASCAQWTSCYGNAMHMARRHRVDDAFLPLLRSELTIKAREHQEGFLIRLHTLGDFYSPAYVQFWANMLDELPSLHIFGYTARREDADDLESQRTAMAIRWLTEQAWDRFAIRFSRPEPVPQGSVVVDAPLADPNVIMCPAQTEATTACATCGLCWAAAAQTKTIGFLRHGMKRSGGVRGPNSRTKSAGVSKAARQRRILAVLTRAADGDGLVTMSFADICDEANTPQTTVRYDLDKLIDANMIALAQQGHGHMPSTYQIIGEISDLPEVDTQELKEAEAPAPAPVYAAHLSAARARLAAFDPILRK